MPKNNKINNNKSNPVCNVTRSMGNMAFNKKSNNGKSKQQQPKRNAFYNPRTPGTIIKALSNKGRNPKLPTDDYVCCRMGMRPTKLPPSIPDGGSGRHMAVCLYSYDTISAGTGVVSPAKWSFSLQTLPTLPSFGYAQYGSGVVLANAMQINGNSYASNVKGMIGRADIWKILQGQTASQTWPGAIDNIANKYQSTSFRIVSMRYKITYTGPVTTCAGAVYAYSSPISIANIGETNTTGVTPPATGRVGVVYLPTGTGETGTRSGTDLYQITGALPVTGRPIMPANTQMFRPEQSITIVPKHYTNKYQKCPFLTTPGLLTQDTVTTGADVTLKHLTAVDPQYGGGLLGFDNDWDSVIVQFNDLNTDASFIIETCVCVEFEPNANSTFYALAKESVDKPASFNAGHRIGNSLPNAILTRD